MDWQAREWVREVVTPFCVCGARRTLVENQGLTGDVGDLAGLSELRYLCVLWLAVVVAAACAVCGCVVVVVVVGGATGCLASWPACRLVGWLRWRG